MALLTPALDRLHKEFVAKHALIELPPTDMPRETSRLREMRGPIRMAMCRGSGARSTADVRARASY
jgi:hypothetical protein